MIKKHLFTLALIGATAFSQVAPMAAFTPAVVQAAKLTEAEQAAIQKAGETSVAAASLVPLEMTKLASDKANAKVLTGSGLYINGGKVKVKSGSTVQEIDNTKEVYYKIPNDFQVNKSDKTKMLVVAVTKKTCSSISINKGKIAEAKDEYKTSLASVGGVKNNVVKVKAGKLTDDEPNATDVRLWLALVDKKNKVFVNSGGTVTANEVAAYQDIPVSVAPKNIEVTSELVANNQATKGTNADGTKFNKTAKKVAVPVTGSIPVWLKCTADKEKKVNINGLHFHIEEAEKTGKGAVTTTLTEDNNDYPATIKGDSAAKNNKVGSVKITFTCLENGKKATVTASVGNPAKKVELAEASVTTNSIVKSCSYTSATNGEMSVGCVLKKDAAKTKKQEVQYTVDVTTASGQATTDKPKIYQVKSDYNPKTDTTDFQTKGKPKETEKSSYFSAKLKTSGSTTKMIVTVPKGFEETSAKTGAFLIVYNNTGSKSGDDYGYVKVNYSLSQAAN